MSEVAGGKLFLAALIGIASLSAEAQEIDADAAYALAKKGNCFKCHALDKRKKAPSYMEVAAKYRGKANGEEALIKHITGAPTVKLEDGDEPHEPPPTKNQAELLNLVRWILSR
jgi:cytochrome c